MESKNFGTSPPQKKCQEFDQHIGCEELGRRRDGTFVVRGSILGFGRGMVVGEKWYPKMDGL